ncbi:putative tellurium resistance membrane protein TerC [Larkinella arboricola]|uniref:Putative tellurium resistance membrane protein TerC n=1 Tax=Larkinella arboricola TaxID=643671 RepID=A0A327WPD7_LARAB|nr:TerC family protein [Larkinella arboricola]RAJ94084.1 putative tellurium resistance membrane protein TerC [Larkinella arboricola]
MEIVDNLVPLLTLIVLEIILGIDNIIFISILADKLPAGQQDRLRYWGLGLAMFMRLALLTLIAWVMQLDQTLFTVAGIDFTGKGLILLAGGLFLIYKSTVEIYHKAERDENPDAPAPVAASFNQLLVQVLILDLVFSIDSIITAVGMVSELWVMYTAVIVTVGIMLIASKPISSFIQRHPSFKILALCFLLIIGMSLVAEGLHFEIPKGYIYFAMAFSFLVDFIQMKTVGPTKTNNQASGTPGSVGKQ